MILNGFDKQASLLGDSVGKPRLTYCTNVHAGETWQATHDGLRHHLAQVRDGLGVSQLGTGLRLAAQAVEALNEAEALEQLKAIQSDGYPLFTVNAFPYGAFHQEPVKSSVYSPDWSTPERLDYTVAVARLMASVCDNEPVLSISTVPGTFKDWVDDIRREQIMENLVRTVAALTDIEQTSGKYIVLAIEPEPCCMVETIDETIRWFEESLFSATARALLARLTRTTDEHSERLLRRHLGICYDVCHAAVEYEDPVGSLQMIQQAGIGIPKIQLSSALRIASVDAASLESLKAFDEPVYLHQVVQARAGQLQRFVDLPQAFEQFEQAQGSEWRVHFHVPVFIEKLPEFETTRFFLEAVLDYYRDNPCSPHLEVETYTWDVLPASMRDTNVSTDIVRELNWVMRRLGLEHCSDTTA